MYGDKRTALDRWAAAYERLSERARGRLAVEHDERAFHVADVLELHRRTGARVVFDWHHHRCHPAPELPDPADALAAAYSIWADGVRPKVHVSSPRTELRELGRRKDVRLVPPLLDQHADFATPWDVTAAVRAAPGPVDVMLEAKAKDLAVLWVREQLLRVDPVVALAEERRLVHGEREPARAATGR
jgi:UV DNA damage endonuclease